MDYKNYLLIALVIAAVVGIIVWYSKQLKNIAKDVVVGDSFTIKDIVAEVKDVFARQQDVDLSSMNLTRSEYEKEERNKQRMEKHLDLAKKGSPSSRSFITESIMSILIEDKKIGLTYDNIDKVIPFNNPAEMSYREKAAILFHIYYKTFDDNGFAQWMQDYGFDKPRNISRLEEEENGSMRYDVTKELFDDSFRDVYGKYELTFNDKLEIIAKEVFSRFIGFGPVDYLLQFAIDEIDVGNHGIMQGSHEAKYKGNIKFSHDAIFVVFHAVNIKLSFLGFDSLAEMIRVCKNIYKYHCPEPLTQANGEVVGEMPDGSRISVARTPICDSWGFWLRRFDTAESLSLSKLLTKRDEAGNKVPETGQEDVITLIRWIVRSYRSFFVTGGMGSGKTTTLKSIIRYLPSEFNIRILEIAPELNAQHTYPERNIRAFAKSAKVTLQDIYNFLKKSNADVNILGEVADATSFYLWIQSAMVGSRMAIGTHHATTTTDLILSGRDNLTNAGGYSNEKVAEETVAKCIKFDIHMTKVKDHRFIERITEVIPIRDRSYPADATHQFSDADTLEYYRRSTDRQSFEVRNILEYRDGAYVMVNPISDAMISEMRDHIASSEIAEFEEDMARLNSHIRKAT